MKKAILSKCLFQVNKNNQIESAARIIAKLDLVINVSKFYLNCQPSRLGDKA